ncbi:hypothetical protein WOLCODRAFT_137556 [Wolfiporia cocos MD-104 SS10]|uniref:DUF6534 domain-containing protein n=1 Tax=Wolfiporia cocos (strain MD-104) TaxID=742152 RepID=A0A2H3JSD7_WOLCO|nr:hypothetical protein WOLCODRAFT_137556 [Wolfiporia cocos MD-104 SS10]
MTTPTSFPVSIPLLAGPQFLGICFNWALLGLLNLQVYLYYDYFPKDRLSLKCLVYSVFIYEWVQTGLITAAAMDVYVYHYGDQLALVEFHNTWFSATIMCGLISATVQCFFAWRIYQLSRSRVLAGCVVVLAFFQGISSIICGVFEKQEVVASALQGHLLKAAVSWLAGSVVVDVLIAVSMTILLLRSKSGIAQTDALINRMVQLVVETGTLTASLAILVLICANVRPLHRTLVYEAPALILTKMYSNTFLTNLNNREYIRRQDKSAVELMPESGSGLRFAQTVSLSVPKGTVTTTHTGESSAAETDVVQKSFVLASNMKEVQKRTITQSDTNTRHPRRNSIV